MWTHPQWQQNFFPDNTSSANHLAFYSQIYSSVEGNTTFYALPNAQTVQRWADTTDEQFKFCFKLPQQITHQNKLKHSDVEMETFLQTLAPLFKRNKIGQIIVQLPPYFAYADLANLRHFLHQYAELDLAVEVRHPDFFNKTHTEKALNQLLITSKVNRVLMDTRPVHSQAPTSEAIIDAQKKKPKVPVHLIATAEQPMVRYIGCSQLADNLKFIQPWLKHFKTWLEQGKTPYLFIHTADNAQVHQLAQIWLDELKKHLGYSVYPDTLTKTIQDNQSQQSSLF
ncbi:hypothetical protein DS2_14944 [Catenovulum agarivorans DS-2]|uniref:DUF72 domain-containing protein n=1 Tax=Catenovulum agarivorans DS-2 TaxID=1328313 RepID=W7QA78_9ALTE|nr:DUF72 domain-containing protein [Catenovulum agarivorans]EWH08916.1 hypothetical protein DS2_14944 [Catenovulum agarivorans DS-2]